MADYRVNLDIFAGPLDLLLYLVRKEEVDIYDIPIARITEQYIHYLEMLNGLDIDLAGDFLVMAATLMQMKSAMLLPTAEVDEPGIDDLADPRAELIRQLLEYKKFKDAANMLGVSADEAKNRFPRPATVIEQLKGSPDATDGVFRARPDAESAIDIEQVNVWDLLEAFDSLMAATGQTVDISHIKDDTPIDLYQIEILHRLQTEGPASFERIFEGRASRMAMIGLFLALLELIREKLIWAEQTRPSAGIYLRALTEQPAERAVQTAIIAAAETENKRPAQTRQQQPPVPIAEIPPKDTPAVLGDKQEKEETTDTRRP